ncbi:hypothetical protein [Aquisphaera insulae]|uniref:hypothetical protein n=1 Tax=Aquisphaera insulae TaxID=2712864 RepID=UPI0013EDAF89|nr:hypothetical protein [Aquisphaera insulae]
MSARILLGIFDAIYGAALLAWMGGLAVSLVATYVRSQGRAAGGDPGRFAWAQPRRVHTWGAIAGAVALPAFVAVPLGYPEIRGPRIAVQSMVILGGILAMMYVANLPAPAEQDRRIARLDLLVILALCGLLAAFATRASPGSRGLVELSPADRVRYDQELDRIIKGLEIKYGLRAGAAGPADDPGRSGHLVEEATIRELESYYREKQRRDLERSRGGPGAIRAEGPRGPTGQPEGD